LHSPGDLGVIAVPSAIYANDEASIRPLPFPFLSLREWQLLDDARSEVQSV
jgi:hypothetical protein